MAITKNKSKDKQIWSNSRKDREKLKKPILKLKIKKSKRTRNRLNRRAVKKDVCETMSWLSTHPSKSRSSLHLTNWEFQSNSSEVSVDPLFTPSNRKTNAPLTIQTFVFTRRIICIRLQQTISCVAKGYSSNYQEKRCYCPESERNGKNLRFYTRGPASSRSGPT
mgnify:CR=1 FL=1